MPKLDRLKTDPQQEGYSTLPPAETAESMLRDQQRQRDRALDAALPEQQTQQQSVDLGRQLGSLTGGSGKE